MRRLSVLGTVLLLLLGVAAVPTSAQRLSSEGEETATPPKPSPFPAAPKFLGEFCLKFTFTEAETGPIVPPKIESGMMSLTWMGGTSYLAQSIGFESLSAKSSIMSGGGFLVGTDLLLTLAFSRDESPSGSAFRDTGTAHIQLNPTTWTGTMWGIFSFYNTSTHAFSAGWRKGTIAPIACP